MQSHLNIKMKPISDDSPVHQQFLHNVFSVLRLTQSYNIICGRQQSTDS